MTSLTDPTVGPGTIVEEELKDDATQSSPQEDVLKSLIAAANIKFHHRLKADFEDEPEFVFGSSDDEDPTPSPDTPEFSDDLILFAKDSAPEANSAVIGGAVVNNICLVVPNEEMEKFGNLPVVAFQGDAATKSQLFVVPQDSKEGRKFQPPALIFPADDDSGYDTERDRSSLEPAPITQSAETGVKKGEAEDTSKVEAKKEDKEKGDKKPEATDLEHYVLSGDIKNFFGITGLKAKLYKFKGEKTGRPDPSI